MNAAASGSGSESRIVSKHTPSAHHHRTKKRETPLGIPRFAALLEWVSAQSQRHSGVTTRTMSTNSPSSMSQVRVRLARYLDTEAVRVSISKRL